jgi:Fe-S cluster biosynthesis and repair protein YggX
MSYGGKIGAALREQVCNVCWTEWYAQSVQIINEYRLNLREAADRETLSTQMKIFFRMLPAPETGLPTGTPPQNA